MVEARSRKWLIHLTTRRYRRILAATLITLLTSVILLGLVALTHWRSHQALQSDTHTVISEVSQQLVRVLQSRRGTLTFIRDALTPQAPLGETQLRAMGMSATKHTRHLLGAGMVEAANRLSWWYGPESLSRQELLQLNDAVIRRTHLRGIWQVPSTFVAGESERPILVMLEPFRHATSTRRAVIGVFDLKSLLIDFFETGLQQRYPVQIADGASVLYRSSDWQPATADNRPILVEDYFHVDAAQWTIQMQPGESRIVQTLSWFNILLISLSIIAGIGIISIVWLLTARTWILQRAVARRTAALKRTSQRLRQLAITDELTGLYNRRFFLDRWAWECERARRYQRPLACLMIDVNGFKQVNDRFGHQAGDLVLQKVARELKGHLRQSDLLARFGGDEFIIALPETTPEQAQTVGEKLRQVHISAIGGEGSRRPPSITLSVGIGLSGQDSLQPQDLIQTADESLYASKRQTKSTAVHLL